MRKVGGGDEEGKRVDENAGDEDEEGGMWG